MAIDTVPDDNHLNHIQLTEFATWSVSFPKAPDLEMPLIGADLYQKAEEHDMAVLFFKGRPFDRVTQVISGDPVIFTYSSDLKIDYKFYGYIHTIEQSNNLQANNTRVVCVSMSYSMKNTYQKIYKDMTANQVVAKLASKHGLKAITQHHPRIRKQIVQAGQSDWQLCKRLANQTGFALRAENASLFFMSKNKIYSAKKPTAAHFTYIDADGDIGTITKAERAVGSILSFDPIISDQNPEAGSRVDRVIGGINQSNSELISTTHILKNNTTDTLGVVIPDEDFFNG